MGKMSFEQKLAALGLNLTPEQKAKLDAMGTVPAIDYDKAQARALELVKSANVKAQARKTALRKQIAALVPAVEKDREQDCELTAEIAKTLSAEFPGIGNKLSFVTTAKTDAGISVNDIGVNIAHRAKPNGTGKLSPEKVYRLKKDADLTGASEKTRNIAGQMTAGKWYTSGALAKFYGRNIKMTGKSAEQLAQYCESELLAKVKAEQANLLVQTERKARSKVDTAEKNAANTMASVAGAVAQIAA